MFKIALRNVFRNRRRTLLSLTVIALGSAALFVAKGYFDHINYKMKLGAVEQYGHLQIASPLLWERSSEGYEHLISKEELAKIEGILNGEKEVEAYTTQLSFSGLIGTEKKSSAFIALGIEPGSAVGGAGFGSFDELITEGENLAPTDKSTILLGVGLAKNLKVQLGEYVNVLSTSTAGAISAGSLKIIGLIETGQPEVDLRIAVTPLFFAQRILQTEGVEKVIVKLKSLEATDSVLARLQRRFDEAGLALKIKTWSDLAVFYHQVRGWFGQIYRFMTVAIFVLVFFSILEVMTMSFFERMREIGTIRAIGTKRVQVFQLFLFEGLLIGFIGGLLGAALGWGFGFLVNEAGIRYIPPSLSVEVPLKIRLVPINLVAPFLTAVLSTLISALYPALKAARFIIVEALRHV